MHGFQGVEKFMRWYCTHRQQHIACLRDYAVHVCVYLHDCDTHLAQIQTESIRRAQSGEKTSTKKFLWINSETETHTRWAESGSSWQPRRPWSRCSSLQYALRRDRSSWSTAEGKITSKYLATDHFWVSEYSLNYRPFVSRFIRSP